MIKYKLKIASRLTLLALTLGSTSCGTVKVYESYGIQARISYKGKAIAREQVSISTRGKVNDLTTDENGFMNLAAKSSSRVTWLGGPIAASLVEQHYVVNVEGYEPISINYHRVLPEKSTMVDGRRIEEEGGIIKVGEIRLARK
ncbi:MAG: hypothetical protein V4733_00015 [Verrucomicrobiota bacterium]